MAVPTLATRIKHTLLGCRPIAHRVVDMRSQRLLDIGRICPVCFRQFP